MGNIVVTGFFDQIVVAFFKSLSLADFLVGFVLLLIVLWFINTWYWRSDANIAVLKEIRDSLKKP